MQRTELLSEPGVPNPVGRMVEEVMSGARASVMIPFVHSLVRLERVGGDHNARLLVAVGSPDGIDLQTVRVRSKARRSSRR
jgi:hypothetical protein